MKTYKQHLKKNKEFYDVLKRLEFLAKNPNCVVCFYNNKKNYKEVDCDFSNEDQIKFNICKNFV